MTSVTANTPPAPAPKKKPRKVRTQREIAQDRLKAAADRQVRAKKALDKARRVKTDAEATFDAAQAEVQAAEKAYKFEAGNPELGNVTTKNGDGSTTFESGGSS